MEASRVFWEKARRGAYLDLLCLSTPLDSHKSTSSGAEMHSISFMEASRVFCEKASRGAYLDTYPASCVHSISFMEASRVFRRRRNVSRLALCFSRFTVSLDSARYSASESSGIKTLKGHRAHLDYAR